MSIEVIFVHYHLRLLWMDKPLLQVIFIENLQTNENSWIFFMWKVFVFLSYQLKFSSKFVCIMYHIIFLRTEEVLMSVLQLSFSLVCGYNFTLIESQATWMIPCSTTLTSISNRLVRLFGEWIIVLVGPLCWVLHIVILPSKNRKKERYHLEIFYYIIN